MRSTTQNVHLLFDWFATLKRQGFGDIDALFIATKNPSHILGMVEKTINICSYPTNKFIKEKVVLNEIFSGIEAEYLKKMAANDHQPPARKPLKI